MATLLPNGRMQICGYSGTPSIWGPLVGGMIYTYAAGTSTPKATYTTAAASVQNENPVVLDARGEATIFWNGAYKIVVRDADDNILYTVDNVSTSISASSVSYGSDTLAFILLNNMNYVVNSIAELRDVDKTLYTSAKVKGYYSEGDGGGGDYYYDSGDTTTPDNGGTVIVASDSGRWKLLNQGTVTAKQFGCQESFTVDCSTELQAALDCFSVGGNVLIDGFFYLNSAITVPKNVNITGLVKSISARADGAYTNTYYPSMLVFSDSGNISISNSRIDGVLLIHKNLTSAGSYPLPLSSGNSATAYAAFSGTAVTITSDFYFTRKSQELAFFSNCLFIGFNYAIYSTDTVKYHVDQCGFDAKNGIYTSESVFDLDLMRVNGCVFDVYASKVDTFTPPVSITRTGKSIYCRGVISVSDTVFNRNDVGIYGVAGVGTVINVSGCNFSAEGTSSIEIGSVSHLSIVNSTVFSILSEATTLSMVGGTLDTLTNNDGYANLNGVAYTTLAGTAVLDIRADYHATPLTFTPSIQFGGASVGITYAIQKGFYTVHDNLVTCFVHIQLTNKGSSTGTAAIAGLPYTSSAEADCYGGAAVQYYEHFDTLVGALSLLVNNNSTQAFFRQENLGADTSTDAMGDTDFKNATIVRATFSYFIDR